MKLCAAAVFDLLRTQENSAAKRTACHSSRNFKVTTGTFLSVTRPTLFLLGAEMDERIWLFAKNTTRYLSTYVNRFERLNKQYNPEMVQIDFELHKNRENEILQIGRS